MKTTDKRYRFWVWLGVRFLHIPFTVKFTPPDSEHVVAIGFAWSADAAKRMQANYVTEPPRLSRAYRRAIKRSAKRAAEDANK